MLRSIKRKAERDPTLTSDITTALQQQDDHRIVVVPTKEMNAVVSHVPVSIGSTTTASLSSGDTNSSISSTQDQSIIEPVLIRNQSQVKCANLPTRPRSHRVSITDEDSPPRKKQCLGEAHVVANMIRQPPLKEKKELLSSHTIPVGRNLHHILAAGTQRVTSTTPRSSQATSTTTTTTSAPASGSVLLARPNDAFVLNPLHVFVRKQIEAFTVTQAELSQPAPGRKKPIQMHQVGLRCIHCKHLPSRDRVKRAVCYPTSVGRVYHSVSDMKFDHFTNCKGMSKELHAELNLMKQQGNQQREPNKHSSSSSSRRGSATSSSSSSSTAQYYHDSAIEMGMVDSGEAIYMSSSWREQQQCMNILSDDNTKKHLIDLQQQQQHQKPSTLAPVVPRTTPIAPARHNASMYCTPFPTIARGSFPSHGFVAPAPRPQLTTTPTAVQPETSMLTLPCTIPTSTPPQPSFNGSLLLSTPYFDEQHLSPLHCFVRRHIEVFIANQDDISAPAPGRKNRVMLGQVGLRCVHCARRGGGRRRVVKRAVCYPPSISGIYHSVSNMKFDHFGICQGLPPDAREEFTRLRAATTVTSSSSSGGKKNRGSSSSSRVVSNSTAQYYHDSAVRLGLVDTVNGIRFHNQKGVIPVDDNISSPAVKTMEAAAAEKLLLFAGRSS